MSAMSDYHARFVRAAKSHLDKRTFEELHKHARASAGGSAPRTQVVQSKMDEGPTSGDGAMEDHDIKDVQKSSPGWLASARDMWATFIHAATGTELINKDAGAAASMPTAVGPMPLGGLDEDEKKRRRGQTTHQKKKGETVPPDGAKVMVAKSLGYRIAALDGVEADGFVVHIGCGEARQPGALGIDIASHDELTIPHDLGLGIPLPDGCVDKLYISKSVLDARYVHPAELMAEVGRVLKPDGHSVTDFDLIEKSSEWEEGKHPRNDKGEFGGGAGGATGTLGRAQAHGEQAAAHRESEKHARADGNTKLAQSHADIASHHESEGRRLVKMVKERQKDEQRASKQQATPKPSAPKPSGNLAKAQEHATSAKFHREKQRELKAAGRGGEARQHAGIAAHHERESARYMKGVQRVNKTAFEIIEAIDKRAPGRAEIPFDERMAALEDDRRKLVLKSLTREMPIAGINEEKRIIYAPALVPYEIHDSGDRMTPEDIEYTAHGYMQHARMVGSEHEREILADVVESFIAPQDLQFRGGPYGDQDIPRGSWMVGIKVHDDEEWDKAKRGEYTGVSTGGFGSRSAWE
jgi:hypothetical protein